MDRALVDRAKKGDREAFTSLVLVRNGRILEMAPHRP